MCHGHERDRFTIEKGCSLVIPLKRDLHTQYTLVIQIMKWAMFSIAKLQVARGYPLCLLVIYTYIIIFSRNLDVHCVPTAVYLHYITHHYFQL